MFDLFSGGNLFGAGAGMDMFSPELIAQRAIAEGIPPPAMAPAARIDDTFGALLQPTAGVTPVPTVGIPRPPVIPSMPAGPLVAPSTTPPTATSTLDPFSAELPGAAKPGSNMADRLLSTLRNVKAPEAPTPQRVGTPAAPRPSSPIQSGQLMALLAALGINEGQGGMKLPSTLGAALRG